MLESCNFWAQVESGSVGGWYPKTGNFSRAMSEDLENEKHAENSCLRQANQNEKDEVETLQRKHLFWENYFLLKLEHTSRGFFTYGNVWWNYGRFFSSMKGFFLFSDEGFDTICLREQMNATWTTLRIFSPCHFVPIFCHFNGVVFVLATILACAKISWPLLTLRNATYPKKQIWIDNFAMPKIPGSVIFLSISVSRCPEAAP